jgi:recombinational DNA repair ATPase RecF
VAEALGGELATSREIILDAFFGRLSESDQRIIDAIDAQREELGKAINTQREQVTERLTQILARQTDISREIASAVEILRLEAERHAEQVELQMEQQEREKEYQQRTIEIGERQSVMPAGAKLWYVAWIILILCVLIVVLLAFIVVELS